MELNSTTVVIINGITYRPKPVVRSEISDLGNQLAASILLQDTFNRIVIPTYEEWIGIGLLEMNDELKRPLPMSNK
jgi:hypothetical protein